MAINKRVFGSDIPERVKKKLEARQEAAGGAAPPTFGPGDVWSSRFINPDTEYGDPASMYAYDEYIKNSFGGELDLSSRTPFIRMWTAVQVVKSEGDIDNLEDWIKVPDSKSPLLAEDEQAFFRFLNKGYMYFMNNPSSYSQSPYIESLVNLTTKIESDPLLAGSRVVWVKDESDDEGRGNHYIVRPPVTDELSNTIIYELGNHVVNTTDQIVPGTQLNKDEFTKLDAEAQTEYITGEQFPAVHGVRDDSNKFLKPAGGITSMTSETEGTLGVIRKTTINFKIFNFADFDEIYNKYFLRPGAQIFVDFGWDTNDMYKPDDLIGDHLQNIENQIWGEAGDTYTTTNWNVTAKRWGGSFKVGMYGQPPYDPATQHNTYTISAGQVDDGYVTKSNGDLEVIVGVVTDYESKVLPTGAVECSLTITSKNAAMLNFNSMNSLQSKVEFLLDHFIQWEALHRFRD